MEIKTSLAGILFEHPIMNAAGTCKTVEETKNLARSNTAAVMLGSITLNPLEGNSGETYFSGPGFSLNSIGLKNPGIEYYQQHPEIAEIVHDRGKPLFVSLAGSNPLEYAVMAEVFLQFGADFVELNWSCPNVLRKDQQERIVCFDLELADVILRRVEHMVGFDARIGVKLSPFSDPFALAEMAEIIAGHKVVKAVMTSNTFPNAFSYNERRESRITPKNGLAGMGGPALKAIALGQVRQLRALLPERIQIVGVGGIATGSDVLDYLRAGATVVQLGTAFFDRGNKVFDQVLLELAESLE